MKRACLQQNTKTYKHNQASSPAGAGQAIQPLKINFVRMKILFTSIFILFSLFSPAHILESIQITYKKRSLVIIKIHKPSPEIVSKAVSISSKIQGITHEYNCSTSGIVVFRYNHNLNERADIIQLFNKIMTKELSGIKTEILFCDIMSNENIGKC